MTWWDFTCSLFCPGWKIKIFTHACSVAHNIVSLTLGHIIQVIAWSHHFIFLHVSNLALIPSVNSYCVLPTCSGYRSVLPPDPSTISTKRLLHCGMIPGLWYIYIYCCTMVGIKSHRRSRDKTEACMKISQVQLIMKVYIDWWHMLAG